MSKEQCVIVISMCDDDGSNPYISTSLGVFNSEEEANSELNRLKEMWWADGRVWVNGGSIYGEVVPFNSLESREIRVSDNGELFLGDPND